MAINFPSNPSDGDIYSAVGRTWQYNATAGAWESLAESNVSLSTLGLVNHELININSSAEFGNALIPDTDITYDLGSTTKKWRDLYLSGSSIQLGTKTITQDNIPEVDLAIAPEVLEIQVAAPDAGQDTAWLWTWEQSTLPYARRTITNSPEVSVPIYKQGSYVVNNFAAYDLIGSMTQTHTLYFKWIDGAGTDNLVSWATSTGPISDSHPDINSGTAVDVQRITLSVPATVTPPTLTAPSVSYTVTNNGAGAYTFSGSASGDNPNIGPFYRGGTYTFNVSASGHPFYLTTDNGTNFSAGTYFGEYTDGVTGSRSDSGAVTITVPNDAPNTLYYQCGNHSAMRGAITVKDLAVEVNNNGNYVIYAQHTQEGHKTPVEIRPIPSLVNQMCLVYDASVNKFVPQDLATYVENTPSFENKIREVAGTAELVVEDGSTVIAKVNVYDDSTYLPLVGNNPGDQAFATDTNILYIWDGTAWQQAGTNNTDDLTEGSTNLFYTDARVNTYLSSNGYDTATNIVATITDSAPTTLDTLNELAAALGDDPNFATTITNQIGTKLSTTDFTTTADTWLGTKDTDDLTEGATNLYYTDARVGAVSLGGSLEGTVNNAVLQYGTSYVGTPAQGSFFFDSLNQKLKVYTGSAFVDAVPSSSGGGGGSETNANTTFVKYTYSVTSTTNAVSGADDNAETLSYVTDGTENVEVFLNGIKQVEGASNDYVATTGSSVNFTFNLASGDVVEVQVYALLTNDAYYTKTETYTRTETNTQISTALAGLVDSAPATLDTLNELAAALGDDPNFATTVTNSIADKLPLSGGTLTGNLTVKGLTVQTGNDATDHVIVSGNDANRVRIFGGSTYSVANGAAVTINGNSNSNAGVLDLASGSGGNINFRIGTSQVGNITSNGNFLFNPGQTYANSASTATSSAIPVYIETETGVNSIIPSTGSTPNGSHGLRIQSGGNFNGAMDLGASGGVGGYIQYHDRTNFANYYPLKLQPNGGVLELGGPTSDTRLNAGTTAQRASSPAAGSFRYNTDDNTPEFYNGTDWKQVSVAASDPYINNVLLYLRGGTTTATIQDSGYSITSQGASLTTAPGKPFPNAPSSNWYQINTNGTGSYINIGNSQASHFSPANYTDFTIEFWIMPYGTNGSYGHFYWVGGQGNQGVIKYGGASSSGGGSSYGMYWYTNTTVIQSGGANSLYQGNWYWMVFEKYGSTNSWWVNGSRVTQNTSGWVSQNNTGDFKLGYSSPQGGENNAHFFDELRITDRARYQGASTIDMQTQPWPTA